MFFSDSFCQFSSQFSDGSHYVTNKQSAASTQNCQKKISLFLQIRMKKNIVCTVYCIAHHDDKTCFLPTCKNHIILLGNVEELLKKLDTFCFTYQHVDCLYTLFKYRLTGKKFANSGQLFDNVQRAVDFNHRNKGVDRMPSIAKKDSQRKSSKSIYSALSKRQKQRRTVVECLQKESKSLNRLNLNWS